MGETRDQAPLLRAIETVQRQERQEHGQHLVGVALTRLAQLQEAGNQQMAVLARGLALVEGCAITIKATENDPASGRLSEIVYVTEAGATRTIRLSAVTKAPAVVRPPSGLITLRR